jgi:hypothetical protein
MSNIQKCSVIVRPKDIKWKVKEIFHKLEITIVFFICIITNYVDSLWLFYAQISYYAYI